MFSRDKMASFNNVRLSCVVIIWLLLCSFIRSAQVMRYANCSIPSSGYYQLFTNCSVVATVFLGDTSLSVVGIGGKKPIIDGGWDGIIGSSVGTGIFWGLRAQVNLTNLHLMHGRGKDRGGAAQFHGGSQIITN